MTQKFTSRHYQRIAADHIVKHKRCAVWIPPGGGKTGATFMAMEELALVDDIYPVLIIAPKRVARDTWINETKKWQDFAHITISPVIGNAGERMAALRQRAMYYTVNPECLEWLVDYHKTTWPFRTIVFDEASRLRGYRLRQGTKRAQALATVAHTHCTRFIELTGSPDPNGLSGLWGQLAFLDQGQRLGKSFTAFQQRWFRVGFDGFSIEPLAHAQKEIQDKIKDICLSIDLKDYFDVRQPLITNINVELPPESRKKYREMEKTFFTELENKPIEAMNAAAKSSVLLQLANGAAYVDKETRQWSETHTVKIEALESLVEDANGTPLFVVTNFVSDRERLLKHFGKNAVDLATTKGFKEFMTGKKAIGLAHPAALGHGVDGLQDVTNMIVFFGLTWDLELYDQVTARIGPVRQFQSGHDRAVFIYHILAKNTLEELVLDRLQSKRTVQDILLNALRARKETL